MPDELGKTLELGVLLAEAWMRSGRPSEARRLLREIVSRITNHEPNDLRRRADNLCGAAHFELGELTEAAESFERALEASAAAADDLLAARATNNLALIANIHGHHDEALARYRTAIPMYQRLGNANGLAESYHNMAITLRDLDDLEDADEYELRSIDFAKEADNGRLAAIAQVGRAEVALRRGDVSMAEATARYAADEFQRLPDPARRADALRVAAVACLTRGDKSASRLLVEAAVTEAHAAGAALIEAECLRVRAELSASEGSAVAALDDAKSAIALFAQLGATTQKVDLQAWIDRLGTSD
jgi:tetratricopeptide (TPR) repeat protein